MRSSFSTPTIIYYTQSTIIIYDRAIGTVDMCDIDSIEAVCMVITYMYGHRVWINWVRLPILLVISRTRKIDISRSPFAPENIISRDGFGRPVPRQPAHSPCYTQAESGAYSRDSSRSPQRRPFI